MVFPLLALAWLLCVPPCAPAQSLLVLNHVILIDATGRPLQSDMAVAIRSGRIESIVKCGSSPIPKGAQVVDGGGRYLIPGLWDMHVHMVFGDWIPKGERVILPLFVANAVRGVRDMGGNHETRRSWGAQIAGGKLLGPRRVIAGPMLDGP